MDENGTATKLAEVENAVSMDWRNDCDYIQNENFTLTDGTVTSLYVDMNGRLITVDASTVIPEIPGYALNRVYSIFGDSAILEYIGEDENDLRYVLCGIGSMLMVSTLNCAKADNGESYVMKIILLHILFLVKMEKLNKLFLLLEMV